MQEGAKFLENAGHLTDGGTRGEAAAVKAAIEESESKDENGDSKDEEKPDLKRKGPDAEIVEVQYYIGLLWLSERFYKKIFRLPAQLVKSCCAAFVCQRPFNLCTYKLFSIFIL